MPYILIIKDSEPQLVGSLKEVAKLSDIKYDNLLYHFSRLKRNKLERNNIKVYKR